MKAEIQVTNHKRQWIIFIGLLIGLASAWSITAHYHSAPQSDRAATANVWMTETDNSAAVIQAREVNECQHYNFLTSFIMMEARRQKKEPVEEPSSPSAFVRISDLFKVLR